MLEDSRRYDTSTAPEAESQKAEVAAPVKTEKPSDALVGAFNDAKEQWSHPYSVDDGSKLEGKTVIETQFNEKPSETKTAIPLGPSSLDRAEKRVAIPLGPSSLEQAAPEANAETAKQIATKVTSIVEESQGPSKDYITGLNLSGSDNFRQEKVSLGTRVIDAVKDRRRTAKESSKDYITGLNLSDSENFRQEKVKMERASEIGSRAVEAVKGLGQSAKERWGQFIENRKQKNQDKALKKSTEEAPKPAGTVEAPGTVAASPESSVTQTPVEASSSPETARVDALVVQAEQLQTETESRMKKLEKSVEDMAGEMNKMAELIKRLQAIMIELEKAQNNLEEDFYEDDDEDEEDESEGVPDDEYSDTEPAAETREGEKRKETERTRELNNFKPETLLAQYVNPFEPQSVEADFESRLESEQVSSPELIFLYFQASAALEKDQSPAMKEAMTEHLDTLGKRVTKLREENVLMDMKRNIKGFAILDGYINGKVVGEKAMSDHTIENPNQAYAFLNALAQRIDRKGSAWSKYKTKEVKLQLYNMTNYYEQERNRKRE